MKPGFTRPEASVKAVPMLPMAVVRVAGVGAAYEAANSLPVT